MTQSNWQRQAMISDIMGSSSFFERFSARLWRFLGRNVVRRGTGKDMQSNEWKIVVRMYGMLEAQALVGRLQAEGIPAQAWQEGAGRAMGITVGYLGEVRVVVPSQFYEEAKEIADKDFSEEVEFDDEEWEDENL